MGELPGALGTTGSMALRFGQVIFAAISLLCMCWDIEFYSYTAFCFLVTVMGLVIPWSLAWAVVDVFSVYVKCPVRPPGILSIVVIGDWILSSLCLGASCSAASVTEFLVDSRHSFCMGKVWARYQLAAAMAFLCWCLLLASFLFNLWLLPSL